MSFLHNTSWLVRKWQNDSKEKLQFKLHICHTYLGRASPNLLSMPAKDAAANLYPPIWSGVEGGRSYWWTCEGLCVAPKFKYTCYYIQQCYVIFDNNFYWLLYLPYSLVCHILYTTIVMSFLVEFIYSALVWLVSFTFLIVNTKWLLLFKTS